jgi:hypothetical protein
MPWPIVIGSDFAAWNAAPWKFLASMLIFGVGLVMAELMVRFDA